MTGVLMRRLGAAAVAGIGVAALVAGAPAAHAGTRSVRDARADAPARVDITSVRFTNDTRLAAQVVVANLRGGAGDFRFTFSPFNSPDIAFIASSRRSAAGEVTNRLVLIDDIGRRHVLPCQMTGRWRAGADVVSLSLPRSCTQGITGPLFMTARLGDTDHRDRVAGVRVRRLP